MSHGAARWTKLGNLCKAVTFAPAVAEEIVEAESSPAQPEPANASAAVAAPASVEAATAASAGLPLTTLEERDEVAPSEFGGESIMFSEAGDSIVASEPDGATDAAGTPHAQRVERQTSPILSCLLYTSPSPRD